MPAATQDNVKNPKPIFVGEVFAFVFNLAYDNLEIETNHIGWVNVRY